MNVTPGPWIVMTHNLTINNQLFGNAIVIQKSEHTAEKDYFIALCGQDDGNEYASEAMANAALISIAPDMLEALIAIQEAARMDMLDEESITKLISDVFAKLANEAGA
jgi:hypothetical protein